jgi:hypothetical protein
MQNWSEKLVSDTLTSLDGLDFIFRDGKVWLKHCGGSFGYITVDDLLQKTWIIQLTDEDATQSFQSLAEMVTSGWVLD